MNQAKNVSLWMVNYIKWLVKDIDNEQLWQRKPNLNCPGWIIMHLIVEGEYAVKKLESNYVCKIENDDDFKIGSSGNNRSELSLQKMVSILDEVYKYLNELVSENSEELSKMPIQDEFLKKLLNVELDYHIHILTTHIAMHCDEIKKWKKF